MIYPDICTGRGYDSIPEGLVAFTNGTYEIGTDMVQVNVSCPMVFEARTLNLCALIFAGILFQETSPVLSSKLSSFAPSNNTHCIGKSP
ncbi:hypothetical protein DPMN_192035 [Dreissena polymorpha]|uniref:Uncharacterized protein n=1 Tax=Dreissena polymorpha TaxID=45954 RepID=A0A9D4B6P7_DREPO|nr:hypothetical protein DPMN_192035 [Dreissena polymorpha]